MKQATRAKLLENISFGVLHYLLPVNLHTLCSSPHLPGVTIQILEESHKPRTHDTGTHKERKLEDMCTRGHKVMTSGDLWI